MKPFNNSAKKVNNMYIVEVWCQCCEHKETFKMTTRQYTDWYYRKRPIQDVFPEMNYKIREMLISGICPTCWDKMFGQEPE